MKTYHEDYFNSCIGISILLGGFLGIAFFFLDKTDGGAWVSEDYPTQYYAGLFLGINSLWMTGRLLASKLGTLRISHSPLKMVIIRNIIAPIIVSTVIYAITGNSSLTFISIPIFGAISASIGI